MFAKFRNYQRTEINQTAEETGRLRSWLPKRNTRESAINGSFFLIIVSLLFTCLFIFLQFTIAEPQKQWLPTIGSTLSSVFLGFCLSNWWSLWQSGDTKRVNAIKIDDQIEEEIQWISENWKQIFNTINSFGQPNEEFIGAAKYLLSAQIGAVQGRMQRMALMIDRLGYSSEKFFAEKRERFVRIRNEVEVLVRDLPDKGNIKEIEALLNNLVEIESAERKMIPKAKETKNEVVNGEDQE